jgi:hypothetical protein
MKNLTLGLLLGIILTGCAKIDRDISNDPIVSGMVGRRYQTKKEFLIYVFGDNKKKFLLHEFGFGPDFPDKLNDSGKFPQKYYGIIIHGVLPPGSQFQIFQVKEEGNTGMSFIMYKAKITSSPDQAWVGKEVFVEELANSLKVPPVFKDDLVQEIVTPSNENGGSKPVQ